MNLLRPRSRGRSPLRSERKAGGNGAGVSGAIGGNEGIRHAVVEEALLARARSGHSGVITERQISDVIVVGLQSEGAAIERDRGSILNGIVPVELERGTTVNRGGSLHGIGSAQNDCACINRRAAGVGVGIGERERASAVFGEAAGAADHAGEGLATI